MRSYLHYYEVMYDFTDGTRYVRRVEAHTAADAIVQVQTELSGYGRARDVAYVIRSIAPFTGLQSQWMEGKYTAMGTDLFRLGGET